MLVFYIKFVINSYIRICMDKQEEIHSEEERIDLSNISWFLNYDDRIYLTKFLS